MIINIINEVRNELEKNSDKKIKESAHRFFKEETKFYGVKTATVSKIARDYWPKVKILPKKEIFNLCEHLLKSDYSEEAFIAFDWVYRLNKKFQKEDFKIFENWIKNYVNNWAKCDVFCNHTIGSFLEMYPDYIKNIKVWTKSKNRWVRRSAASSLIVPAKHGLFLEDIFEIADSLLLDTDDLVQKGYGWMLKVASFPHQKEVFKYVMKNKSVMPRTALRYAIEKMPKNLKVMVMQKE